MDVLIIGGGLSGLALAEALDAQNRDYMLVEARGRFGGRIKTAVHAGGAFDLGPAWFWPGQPRIAALIDRLGLEKFDQFADGALTYEDERGQVDRGRGFSSMQGSWRLKGGLEALTQSLAARVPDSRKRLNAPVVALTQSAGGVIATLHNGEKLEARQVVLALPPRIAAQIACTPALPAASIQTMQGVATWMAGQAKAVAVYDRPFWRHAGFSGDAMSRKGPLVEVHDASPENGGPYALFGFIGTPPPHRAEEDALRRDVIAQLTRLFGQEASTPSKLYIKDWAFDSFTATEADKAPLYAHPTYGLPEVLRGLWDGRLQFAGTEVAPQFGGYLEGALEAAENVLLTMQDYGRGHVHAD